MRKLYDGFIVIYVTGEGDRLLNLSSPNRGGCVILEEKTGSRDSRRFRR